MAATLPCPSGVHCFGTDYPISNYSSELEDELMYVGLAFPGQGFNGADPTCINCIGPSNPPDLGSDIVSPGGCLGIGEESTQGLANNLALATALACGLPPAPGPAYNIPPFTPGSTENTTNPGGGVPNGKTQIPQTAGRPGSGVGMQQFLNQEQTASCNVCPDLTTGSSYTVPAGTYSAKTQALADALAKQAATAKALANCICVPDLSSTYCVNETLAGTGNITGAFPPFQIALSGNVPNGYSVIMTSDTEYLVTGTLTQPGNFQFTVKVTDAKNQTSEGQSQIDILGIDNIDTMSQGQCENPYNFQLNGAGGQAPYTFELLNPGALPGGLTFNANGLISGTPTGCGSESLSVKVTDSSDPPRSCEDSGTIDIVGPCVPPVEMTLIAGVLSQNCPGENPDPAIGYYPGTSGYTSASIPNPPGIQLCTGQTGPVTVRVVLDVKFTPMANPGPYQACDRSFFTTNPSSCLVNMACGSVTIPANTFIYGDFHQEWTGTANPGDPMYVAANAGPGKWEFRLTCEEV